jgi:hypothetical protein
MLNLPPPNNWLLCREAYQLSKYLLLKDQRELKEALGIFHDWQLERALITLPCIYGVHKKAADKYKQSSNEFDEVSRHYEKACEIHREAMKKYDDNRPTITKSK